MRSQKCSCIPGGKGVNVSRAVKALGCATRAMAIVGGHTGAHVVGMIEDQDGVNVVPVWVKSPTRTITTVLENVVHRQTAFFEPGSRVTDEEARGLVIEFEKAVQGARVVTFNGTVPDPNIRTLYRDLIPIAKAAGAMTVLDSHGPELGLGLESVPYMVKPNVAETQELVGFSLNTHDAKLKAADFFHGKGVQIVVISLGKDGALVSGPAERFYVIPPEIQEVNPVGSGDALVAGFAIGLMEQIPLEETAKFAIAAGTANAMSWDIGHFTATEVRDLLGRVTIREV
jgi:tagatose 6-phosphate kinase